MKKWILTLALSVMSVSVFGYFAGNFPCGNYYCDAPCFDCCSYFYLGVEGGWATGLGHARKSTGVGGAQPNLISSTAFDAKARSGYNIGASLGYRWNCLLRTDLSYTYLHPSSYRWKTDFNFASGFTEHFKERARLHSHLFLFNTYLHFNGLCCLFSCVDPYITGGVGVAINDLYHIREIVAVSGITLSHIKSHQQTNFGARVGIGVMKCFCKCWILDVGFNANYIGKVRSGNTRSIVPTGILSSITPYSFKRNWIGTFFVGIKNTF